MDNLKVCGFYEKYGWRKRDTTPTPPPKKATRRIKFDFYEALKKFSSSKIKINHGPVKTRQKLGGQNLKFYQKIRDQSQRCPQKI